MLSLDNSLLEVIVGCPPSIFEDWNSLERGNVGNWCCSSQSKRWNLQIFVTTARTCYG